ncbi:MAG TPA: hypothetical protein VJB60_02240 [Candidatus Peribacterales bacterium]|nr:hypothetical protein [Candidatus Peribacterales bacterium]
MANDNRLWEHFGAGMEYLPVATGQAPKVFHAPNFSQDPSLPNLDVLVSFVDGPARNGAPIDPNIWEREINVRIAGSDPSHVSHADFVIQGCRWEYALRVREQIQNLSGLAPNNVVAAVDTLLNTGFFDYKKDEGWKGKTIHERSEARLYPQPILQRN